eukprot:1541416-Rhodomonas_salina.1
MSGTEIRYAATSFPLPQRSGPPPYAPAMRSPGMTMSAYAISGTDLAYGPTRECHHVVSIDEFEE